MKDTRETPSPETRLPLDNEALLSAILESAQDYGIIATDMEGRITFWNEGACRLLGWRQDEVLGQPADLFVTPEDRASGRPQEEREMALAERRAADERWHERRDGSQFWALGEMQPLTMPSGEIIGFLKILRDRTEQYLAIQLTREQSATGWRVPDALSSGLIVLSLDGRLKYMSEGCKRIMEVDDFSRYVDQQWADWWSGQDRHDAQQALARAAKGGIGRFQGLAPTASGIPRWWDVQVVPCLGGEGEPERIICIAQDITHSRRGPAPAQPHEAHVQAAEESIESIVWTTEANGEVSTRQPGWEALTGQTFEQYKGWGWTQALHPGDIQAAMDGWLAAIKERRAYRVECRVRRRDGSWGLFSISSTPQFDAQGRVSSWIGAHIDISSHRAAQEALRLETNRLRILNRVGTRLAAELDLDKLVQEATDAAVALTGAQFGAFFYNVIDQAGESYMLYALSGVAREAFSKFPMPRNTAVFSQTFKGLGVMRSDDITRDPRYGRNAPHRGMPEGHLPVRSYLAVPVMSRSGEVLGGLLFGHEAPGMFNEEHEHLLIGIAGQAAIAIDNARLFRASQLEIEQRKEVEALANLRNERLQILSEAIERTPSAHSLKELIGILAEAGARLAGADGVALVLREGEMCHCVEEISPTPLWTGRRIAMRDCLSGQAMHTQRTIAITDVSQDPRAVPELYDANTVRGLVMVPIVSDGESIAAIGLRWSRPHPATDDEIAIIEAMTRSAGAVLKRLEAEQALRTLNETLEAQVAERTADRDRMWRLSAAMMLVARFDGTINAVNPAWQHLLGWEEHELLGHRFYEFIHPDDLDHTRAEVEDLTTGKTTLRLENRCRHKDGSYRWLSWIAVPEDGLIHAVGRDINAEKEQAQALQLAEEALRQAQKMEAVGQLTGGIAHDFNNLLTGIIGSLDMMQIRIAQGRFDAVERYHHAAMASATRAGALTHRLLAFARRQPLAPKPVDANRMVVSMEELLRRTLGESIDLELVTAGGLWLTLCDPNQLESAILNLAINARDAMSAGGKLTIETCNTHLDRTYTARFHHLKPGQYVCIAVTDTGTGMAPQVIERAFDPFFTTKPVGQGTGLGLSMIYGFAQQSEGHARIYSEVGQGSTVKLYLPRAYGEAEDDQQLAGLNDAHRTEEGETVLVVEDEPVVRDLIVEVLRDLGYRTLEAADGPDGLQLLHSRNGIDLLITDMGLPGMNGRQLADQARLDRPELKVLFITGYAENATLASGFLEPGMEMLTKPFAIETLAQRVREMIER